MSRKATRNLRIVRPRHADIRPTLRLLDTDERDELPPPKRDDDDGEMPRAFLSLVSARILRDDESPF